MRQSARYPSSRRQAVASSDEEDSVDGLESPPHTNNKQRGIWRTGGLTEEEGHYPASDKPVQSRYDNPYSDYSDGFAASSSEEDDVPQREEKKRRSSRSRNFAPREQRLFAFGRSRRPSASSQGHELSTLSTQGEGGGSRPANSRRASWSSLTTLAPSVAPSNVLPSPPNVHPCRRYDKGCIVIMVIVVVMILAIFGFVVGMSIKSAIAAQQRAESAALGVDDSIAR